MNRTVGSGTKTLIATLPASTTSFDDSGLANATGYTFSVTLTTTTERVSSAASVVFTSLAAPAETTNRYADCRTPTVTVRTGAQLQAATNTAQPGDVIRAYTNTAPGVYTFADNATVQVNDKHATAAHRSGSAAHRPWSCSSLGRPPTAAERSRTRRT